MLQTAISFKRDEIVYAQALHERQQAASKQAAESQKVSVAKASRDKQYSMNPEAVKKRKQREMKKAAAATSRNGELSKQSTEDDKKQQKAPPGRGNHKKRRHYDDSARQLVVSAVQRHGGSGVTKQWATVAVILAKEHPQIFGTESSNRPGECDGHLQF